MGRPRRLACGLAGLLLAVAPAACGDDDDSPRVTAGEGYLAVLDWAIPHAFPLLAEDDPQPVVFIATSDGSAISAQAQATVARDADDRITVNFVDTAEDAIDPDSELESVRDDGVLLTVEPIDDSAGSSTGIDVALYTNYVDNSLWTLLLVADDDGVTVAQETEQVTEEVTNGGSTSVPSPTTS